MRNLIQKPLLLTVLLFLTLLFVGFFSAKSGVTEKSERPSKLSEDSDIGLLRKYQTWTKVNPEPVLMDQLTAVLCAAANSGQLRPNPHSRKYISVFVNVVGQESMLTKREPVFPVGTMIVKEKLSNRESKTPELLTAMIKREKGYFPEGGDWEYLSLDGTATKILERGKLDQCNSCHQMYKGRDFVTRIYLPRDIANQLK